MKKLLQLTIVLLLTAVLALSVVLRLRGTSTETTGGISALLPQAAAPTPTTEPTEIPQVVFQNGSFPVDASSIKVVLQPGETALLDQFTALRELDAEGSSCYLELLEYAAAHPALTVRFTAYLPNGTAIDNSTTEADLCGLKHGEVAEVAALLRYYPQLEVLELGTLDAPRPGEDTSTEPAGNDPLGWADVAALQAALPEVAVRAHFTLFGKKFTTADEQMVLSHRTMKDNGAAVLAVLPYMNKCTFLDMDSCGVDNEHMAAIRDAYPGIKVVWRVWFGRNNDYTCRTDVTRILASSESRYLDDWNADGLYYCTDVVLMDIGHSHLKDLSFLYNMPKLEVLILACAPWSDATPIGCLENLEYLEIESTNCVDVTPLANLKNLKHLNIANCWQIRDITALYTMTQLERLWIGCVDPIPTAQKETIREMLPDTEINTSVSFHKTGWSHDADGHRTERYALLRKQFGRYQSEAYCYSWSDILYTKSIDELTEEERTQIKP